MTFNGGGSHDESCVDEDMLNDENDEGVCMKSVNAVPESRQVFPLES